MGTKVSKVLGVYSRFLDAYPFASRAITASFLAGCGDLMSQKLIEKNKVLDKRRSLCMFTMGFFLIGPSLYIWYSILYKLIQGQSTMIALKRLFFDQFAFTPISTVVFLSVPYMLEGKAKQVPTIIKANYFTTLVSGWCLWIPANFITFRFIPLKYSVLFVNFVSLFWNSFASWKAHVVKKNPKVVNLNE